MSEDLNQSRIMPIVEGDLPPIPPYREHERAVKRLWITCFIIAGAVFVCAGTPTFTMFALGMDPEKLVAISTSLFQIILMSYGMGFFVPAFLTSLARLRLSVHMMYESLRMGYETMKAMKEMRDEAKPLFKDMKELVTKVKPFADELTPDLVQELRGYLKDIRNRVVRDTEPLPVRRREEEPAAAATGDGDGKKS